MDVNHIHPGIRRIQSISEINKSELNENTLMVFDCDETLLIDKDNKRHDIDINCLKGKQFIPIEENISKIMHELKIINGEKKILACTKRKYSPKNSADQQLKSLDIPFSRYAFKQHDNHFILGSKKNFFNCGVIYTAGENKGEALQMFFKMANYYPKKIVMVDDKVPNLNQIYDFAKKMKIPLTSYLMEGANKFSISIPKPLQIQNTPQQKIITNIFIREITENKELLALVEEANKWEKIADKKSKMFSKEANLEKDETRKALLKDKENIAYDAYYVAEELQDLLKDVIKDKKKYERTVLAAFDTDKKIQGIATGILKGSCELEWLSVNPDSIKAIGGTKSGGNGTALVKAFTTEALKCKHSKMMVKSILSACDFYKKLGFVLTGNGGRNFEEMSLSLEGMKKLCA